MAALRSSLKLRASAGIGLAGKQAPRGIALPRRSLPASSRQYASSSSSNGGGAASSSSSSSSSSGTLAGAAVLLLAGGAGGYYFYSGPGATAAAASAGKGAIDVEQQAAKKGGLQQAKTADKSGIGSFADYQEVYNEIASELERDAEYDDGTFGPVLIRLAWHASGTYDKNTKSGGSNGATMRFAPEANHGANAGLIHARRFMDEVHKKHPWITYSDLWTLGGICAVQEMGGPKVPWRPGRSDKEEQHCTPDGRLPDGDKGSDHLRTIFYRMGFNDQEIVALSGAHAVGRCHSDRSGFEGPWTHSPISFTNEYYNLLLNEKWSFKKWNGPKQYQDKSTSKLMMLTTDMALVEDQSFKKHVQRYAKSEDVFFDEFSKVFSKLLELGVPEENFKTFETSQDGGRPFLFATTAEIENSK